MTRPALPPDERTRLLSALRDRDETLRAVCGRYRFWCSTRLPAAADPAAVWADYEPVVRVAVETGLRRGGLLNVQWATWLSGTERRGSAAPARSGSTPAAYDEPDTKTVKFSDTCGEACIGYSYFEPLEKGRGNLPRTTGAPCPFPGGARVPAHPGIVRETCIEGREIGQGRQAETTTRTVRIWQQPDDRPRSSCLQVSNRQISRRRVRRLAKLGRFHPCVTKSLA